MNQFFLKKISSQILIEHESILFLIKLQACNFPVNISKFLRTVISKQFRRRYVKPMAFHVKDLKSCLTSLTWHKSAFKKDGKI